MATATVAGVRYSYGVVLVGLSEHTGEAVGVLALGMALHWIVMSASAPLAWRLYLRIGARPMILLAGALCTSAFAVLPAITVAVIAAASYGVLSGLGSHGIGQLVANRPLIATVPSGARRDRLFGIITAGSPLGTAAFPATGAIAISAFGWTGGCLCLAGMILAACLTGAALTLPSRASRADVDAAVTRGDRGVWRTASFLLLAAGFAFALFVQVCVPYVIPLWGATGGYSAGEVATAFAVLGGAGLCGRLAMTQRIVLWGLRLWVAIPATLVAVTGFAIAAFAPEGSVWFLPGIALMGFATPVIGALFAIATLACFPEESFARVAGALLVPIGIASAASAVLPGAIMDAGLPLATAWLALAALSVAAAVALVCAELVSPLRRRGATTSDADHPHSTYDSRNAGASL